MTKITSLFLTILIILFEYGCSPGAILASGGASTMVMAEDDRSAGDVIDDATIKIKIASKFIASEQNLFMNLDTSVIEGRVLLTGIVEDQEARIEATGDIYIEDHSKKENIFARITEESKNDNIVFLGILPPDLEKYKEDAQAEISRYKNYYLEFLNYLDKIPFVAIVMASEDVDFHKIFTKKN